MAFEWIAVPSRAGRGVAASIGVRPPGIALTGPVDNVIYPEVDFRHLLFVEQKRAEQSNRVCFLVLLRFCGPSRRRVPMTPRVASLLFDGLGLSVREGDFIGWYREQRIAAAVLAQGPERPPFDASARIAGRIADALTGALSPRVAEHLRVRVVTLRGTRKPLTPMVEHSHG